MSARWPLLLLVVPLAAAAPRMSTTAPEDLLRAADDAYRANDLTRAAELYDRAGIRTIEPSRAAFNLATAKYLLARDGKLEALGDAEVGYRCCLEKGDPYRARALFGLGNCLLVRATGGKLDRATLRAAIDRFSACLADPSCEPALAADARHNRARTRLLLLQAPPPPPGTSDESGNEDDPKQPDDQSDPPSNPNDGGGEPGTGTPKATQGSPSAHGTDQAGAQTEGATGAGQVGKLPPVKDDDSAAPLSARDAAEHIERAERKIIEDLAAYRRGKSRPTTPGVRDW